MTHDMTHRAAQDGDIDVSVLTLEQKRALRAELDELIDRETPMQQEAVEVFRMVAETVREERGHGLPLEVVAEGLGIDLEHATVADSRRLAHWFGASMARPAMS